VSLPILERLKSPRPGERAAACRDAAADPMAILLVDALCEALGDPQPDVARAAGEALVRLGRRDDAVLPALDRALRGDDGRRRLGAALAWARLEPPPLKLLPVLVEGLEHARGDLRWSAAQTLVDMGRSHGEVLRLLLALAEGGERPAARRMAVHALRELAPDEPAVARALVAASRDGDAGLRRAALTAMGRLLAPPAEVLARLDEALGEGDPPARRAAQAALSRLRG